MRLILATNNSHKLSEIKDILGEDFDILSLKDVGINTDIDENGETLLENSRIKAMSVSSILEKNNYPYPFIVIADDTGLLVDELMVSQEYTLPDMPEEKDTTVRQT